MQPMNPIDLHSAVKRYFDAQLALQNDAFATFEAGLTGAIALNRATLRLATRALDQGFENARTATPQLARSLENAAIAIPVDIDTQKRLTSEAHTAARAFADTTQRAQVAVRDATNQAVESIDAMLSQWSTRTFDGLKVVQDGATRANRVACDAVDRAVTTIFDNGHALVTTQAKPEQAPAHQ